LKRKRKS